MPVAPYFEVGVGVGEVRVGRVQRHALRAKPAAAALVVAAAVGSWATRVGGSAHAWQTDARGISNCRQERHAQAHGWEMSADVKGIED